MITIKPELISTRKRHWLDTKSGDLPGCGAPNLMDTKLGDVVRRTAVETAPSFTIAIALSSLVVRRTASPLYSLNSATPKQEPLLELCVLLEIKQLQAFKLLLVFPVRGFIARHCHSTPLNWAMPRT
jgi:hypothetical protein